MERDDFDYLGNTKELFWGLFCVNSAGINWDTGTPLPPSMHLIDFYSQGKDTGICEKEQSHVLS